MAEEPVSMADRDEPLSGLVVILAAHVDNLVRVIRLMARDGLVSDSRLLEELNAIADGAKETRSLAEQVRAGARR